MSGGSCHFSEELELKDYGFSCIQAQTGNTVFHMLMVKLQKNRFAPKTSCWDPARKCRIQGSWQPALASLNATCVSPKMLMSFSEPQRTKVILVTTVDSLDTSPKMKSRIGKDSRMTET